MSTLTYTLTVEESALAMAAIRQTAEALEGNLTVYNDLCSSGEKPLPDSMIDSIRTDILALRALREKLLTSGASHV